MILSFKVNEQTITARYGSIPRVGSKEYLYLHFDFSKDWANSVITCFISSGDYNNPSIVDAEGNVLVPEYYTQQSSFSFTVVGINNDVTITTNVITVSLGESGKTWEAFAPDPDSTAYQQLIKDVQGATHASYIGENNNWYIWDSVKGEYPDSGVPAQGSDIGLNDFKLSTNMEDDKCY